MGSLTGRLTDFVQRYAIALLVGVVAILFAFAAVQTVRIEGLKIWPLNIEGLSAKADRLANEVDAANDAFDLSEALRGQEQAQDQASFTATETRCDERITKARNAGRIIEEITNAQASTDSPAVARPIVPAGLLRTIAGQADTAPPIGVPIGGDHTAPR